MANGISGMGAGGGLNFQMLDQVGKGGDAADKVGGAKPTGGFGEMLKSKLSELNESQAMANSVSNDVATGRADDIAQSMMQIEQANVSLQMATQVRNKVIEAYQEVLRMQV